jgi:hypothetical protein
MFSLGLLKEGDAVPVTNCDIVSRLAQHAGSIPSRCPKRQMIAISVPLDSCQTFSEYGDGVSFLGAT